MRILRTFLPILSACALSCGHAKPASHAITLSAPPARSHVEPPPPAPRAGAFCAAMKAASEAVAARVKPKEPNLASLDFLKCAEGAKGGWALRIDDALLTKQPDSDEEMVGFAVVLVHRDASGALTTFALPSENLSGSGHAIDASVTAFIGWGARRITDLVVGDVDGDGDPEAYVAGGVFEEGQKDLWGKLYTFAKGQIVSYAPAKDLDVVGFEDVDRDERFDVLTRGPYASFTMTTAMPAEVKVFDEALFVAHAQPGGTFSMTDAAARADLKRRCSGGPRVLVTAYDESDAPKQVVCERAFGVSAAQVKTDLRAHCTKFVDTVMNAGECAKVLLDIADETPPVSIAP